MQKTINFTDQEAQVLIDFINIAVKSEGIKVAENAIYLTRKIENSFTKYQKTPIGGGGGGPIKTEETENEDSETTY